MDQAVLTVVGRNRVGIVRDVATLLADCNISIINISQQLMEDFFTMIILADMSQSTKTAEEMVDIVRAAGERFGLDLHLQNTAIFNAMHRV
ncbi:MAG: ACT domain-containing protein [Cardiobacteriaceae bacterium]|nr:ACT domain-containing protein [Cardiobacteriaceae bacterium]